MKRRTFLNTVGATTATSWAASNSFGLGQTDSKDLLATFHRENDKTIDGIIKSQQTNSAQPFFGGFPDRHGIFHVGSAAWNANRLASGLISRQSKFFRSVAAEKTLNLAIDFILDRQHKDGTIDLVTTNFHSPPDTGFVVEPIALALCVVRLYAAERFRHFQRKSLDFLLAARRALASGGIHTPNHRWVVGMALAWIHKISPDKSGLVRIEQWLAEKIDIDADGQYTEKSTSVYSPLVNRCLITMARLLDRPELLEPVRKNLEMTKYLVRENGELVTEVSRRQDQYAIRKPGGYYYSYRFLALHDKNRSFSAMAQAIEKWVDAKNLAGQLGYWLEDPGQQKKLPPPSALPDNYRKIFAATPIVRIRRNKIDATVLAGNNAAFSFHKGRAALQSLRLASAFFGIGQFTADSLKQENGKIVLQQELVGPYYQPLPQSAIPGDGDWSKMPIQRRPQSNIQRLKTILSISEDDSDSNIRFRIDIKISGTDRVPVAIELAFRKPPAADFNISGASRLTDIPAAYLVDGNQFRYEVAGEIIDIRIEKPEAFSPRHQWTQLRGALPKLDANSVYITDFTPLDMSLVIS